MCKPVPKFEQRLLECVDVLTFHLDDGAPRFVELSWVKDDFIARVAPD
jgi:hypothetical protein